MKFTVSTALALALAAMGPNTAFASDVGVTETDKMEQIIIFDTDLATSIACNAEIKNGIALSDKCKAYYGSLFEKKIGQDQQNFAAVDFARKANEYALLKWRSLPDGILDRPRICTLIQYGPDSPWHGVCS